MKKVRRFFAGEDVEEAANASAESQDIAKSMGAGPKNEETPKAKDAAPKPRVVTKEELAKSGLSLRDFLNKERGLTRRKDVAEKAVTKAEPEAETKPAPKTGSIMDKSPEERAAMVKLGLQRQEADRAMKAFKAKKSTGMKSGGSVSSASVASRRGDGIAQRGKTRGKMC